jgi:ABC-type transporter Mla subunit MlaD
MSVIKSRKKNQPFLVGLFTIIGLTIVIVTVIWLGANEFFKQQKFYVTYFDTSVEGLTIGSPVKYQGVPVGIVNKISVADDGRIIQVIMEIDPKIDINDSLRVKSAISGIAGGKFLQLHYPDNPVTMRLYPKVKFPLPERVSKYIKSAPSDIEEIQIAANEVISNLKTLEIGTISDKTIEFLSTSTNFLDSATRFMSNKELYTTISNLNDASANLRNFMEQTENSTFITDMNATGNRLLETANKLEQFTVAINRQLDSMQLANFVNKSYDKYDSLMNKLANSISVLTFRTESVLLDIDGIFSEIKSTNKEIRKSINVMSEETNRVLSKPPKKKN